MGCRFFLGFHCGGSGAFFVLGVEGMLFLGMGGGGGFFKLGTSELFFTRCVAGLWLGKSPSTLALVLLRVRVRVRRVRRARRARRARGVKRHPKTRHCKNDVVTSVASADRTRLF